MTNRFYATVSGPFHLGVLFHPGVFVQFAIVATKQCLH